MKVIVLEYPNYIGDCSEELKELILDKRYKRILIAADTGAGKTTALLQAFEELNKKYFFMVPYTAQVEQFQMEQREGLEAIKGNERVSDPSTNVLLTYEKYWIHSDLEGLEERVLVFDEAHTLVTASSYRAKAFEAIEDVESKFEKVIRVTATPDEVIHKPDYDLMVIFGKKGGHIPLAKRSYLYRYLVNKESEAVSSFLSKVVEKHSSGKIDVIRINVTQDCEIFKRYLEKLGYKVGIIYSAIKKESECYKSICEDKVIPGQLDFLISTSLIDDGVNILNENIGNVWLFNCARPVVAKQFSARFRRGYDTFNIFNYWLIENTIELQSDYNTVIKDDIAGKLKMAKEILSKIKGGARFLGKKNSIGRDIRNSHYLKHSKLEVDHYKVIDDVYGGYEYCQKCIPTHFLGVMKSKYGISMEVIENFDIEDIESGIEKIKSMEKQDKVEAKKSLDTKMSQYGESYPVAFADMADYSRNFKVREDLDVEEYREMVSSGILQTSKEEKRLIKKYLDLRNEGVTHEVAEYIVLKGQEKKVKDVLGYLAVKESIEKRSSLEGRLVHYITSWIEENKIGGYDNKIAISIARGVNKTFDLPNVDKNLVKRWLRIIYQVERKESGRNKRTKIKGYRSYENYAKELGIAAASLRRSVVESNHFYNRLKVADYD